MKRAEVLSTKISAWGRKVPGSRNFAKRLVEAVQHIDSQFLGAARDKLLDEAEAAFDRQRESHDSVRRAMIALRELREVQEKLIDLLLNVTSHRPPGATIH